MWKLHSLASAYGSRPSSYLGLPPDSWEAYQLDLAALEVGRWVEGKLNERDKQNRPKHHLEDLLSERPALTMHDLPVASAKTYQSAVATGVAITKMAIPADGVW